MTCSSRTAKTWKTLSASEIHVKDGNTKRSHRKQSCRFDVRTGEPSNSLIFLDLTVAKCPLEETLSRMKKVEETVFEVENVEDFWSVTGQVISRHHEYIDQHGTSRVKQHSPFACKRRRCHEADASWHRQRLRAHAERILECRS